MQDDKGKGETAGGSDGCSCREKWTKQVKIAGPRHC